MLVPNTNTKARCTGDDETPPRPGTRPVDAAQCAVEDTSIDGPEFAATPGVAARGPYLLTVAPSLTLWGPRFTLSTMRVCGLRCRSGSSLYIYRVYLVRGA